MRYTVSRRSAICSGLAAAVAVAGRPPAAFAQVAARPIIVGTLPSTSLINLYYGIQQNAFAGAGLDITLQPMPNGAAALAAVAGGSINIAQSNVLSLAQAYLRGIPVRIIASSGSYNPESVTGNQLLVAPDSPIRTVRDLEGKTIAVTSVHDLMTVAISSWLDANHVIFPILLLVGLYALGGMSWLVWGGFLRTILVLHTTWLVNSASHIWGYRSHPTRDKSTNLWWVALLTYGEGWHNNHHAFQTSARHGLRWWELDLTYVTIKLMSWLGMAGNIKLPKLAKLGGAKLAGQGSLNLKPDELVDDPTQFVPSGV